MQFLNLRRDLHASVGDDHGLLKLGREFPILGHRSPVVWPGLVAPHLFTDKHVSRFKDSKGTHPLGDHGLNGKAMARLHHTHSLVLCIVRHIGCAVEQPVCGSIQQNVQNQYYRLCSLMDSMTTVAPNNTVTTSSGVLLDDPSHVPVLHPWLHALCDGLLQALPSVHH